jgi:hypothetical protein
VETTALRNTIPDGELNTEKCVPPPPPPITYLRKGAFQQISYNQQSSFKFPSDLCSLLSHLTFYKAITSRLVQNTAFYMLLTSLISQLFKTQFRILFPTPVQVIFLPPCCETNTATGPAQWHRNLLCCSKHTKDHHIPSQGAPKRTSCHRHNNYVTPNKILKNHSLLERRN